MTDRSKLPNAFQFIAVSSARAHQLLRGSVPKVDGPRKPARIALKEVLTGAVREQKQEAGSEDEE